MLRFSGADTVSQTIRCHEHQFVQPLRLVQRDAKRNSTAERQTPRQTDFRPNSLMRDITELS